jgi:hypothetical protein
MTAKTTLFFACVLFSFPLFSQGNLQLIWLTDGSFLKGTTGNNPSDSVCLIRLTDGTTISLPGRSVLKIRDVEGTHLLLFDGRLVKKQGAYANLSFHSMWGKRSEPPFEDVEASPGFHFSVGYRYKPSLGFGIGMGIDGHEYVMLPVFFEFRGFLVKKNQRIRTQESLTRLKKQFLLTRKLPLCYSLQVGYNVPVDGLFSSETFESVEGGVLIYPSIGLMLPSRGGSSLQVDAGYKFQRYKVVVENPWWSSRERVLLKNFTLRLGYSF